MANYIINVLEMEQIGILDSTKFPTISLIREGIPYNPVRIYAGERIEKEGEVNQVVVFISEFQPPQSMIRPITTTILDWMEEQNCTLLISPEGFVMSEGTEEGNERSELKTYGIGSTDNANALLEKYRIERFSDGVISGVSGVLLNEGKRRNLDVLCLLSEAHADFPDARAAAKIIETIDGILLRIKIDADPLYEQATAIEKHIQMARKISEAKKAPISPIYGYG